MVSINASVFTRVGVVALVALVIQFLVSVPVLIWEYVDRLNGVEYLRS
jgi:hypothetical protein